VLISTSAPTRHDVQQVVIELGSTLGLATRPSTPATAQLPFAGRADLCGPMVGVARRMAGIRLIALAIFSMLACCERRPCAPLT